MNAMHAVDQLFATSDRALQSVAQDNTSMTANPDHMTGELAAVEDFALGPEISEKMLFVALL